MRGSSKSPSISKFANEKVKSFFFYDCMSKIHIMHIKKFKELLFSLQRTAKEYSECICRSGGGHLDDQLLYASRLEHNRCIDKLCVEIEHHRNQYGRFEIERFGHLETFNKSILINRFDIADIMSFKRWGRIESRRYLNLPT